MESDLPKLREEKTGVSNAYICAFVCATVVMQVCVHTGPLITPVQPCNLCVSPVSLS